VGNAPVNPQTLPLAGDPSVAVELSLPWRSPRRGTLEFVFETDEKNLPQTVPKEKVAEIAVDVFS
jgi:hypothetical protein